VQYQLLLAVVVVVAERAGRELLAVRQWGKVAFLAPPERKASQAFRAAPARTAQ